MSSNDLHRVPLVAVVGRPNVGKSTFVNRITGKNDAIVHQMRGVTRDRSYHMADWNGVKFKLIDTGGIEISGNDVFQSSIRAQALESTNESDAIVFLVDGSVGIQNDDITVANILRKSNKQIFLVVNKVDRPASEEELWEFYNLGLGDPFGVSALHGHGTGDLLDKIVQCLPQAECLNDDDDTIKIAIIGRPNAGKSTLTNCMTGKNRSIVSDVAGTTRDSIDTFVSRKDKVYTIIDTAGMRKKSSIDKDVEYYSFVRSMRAIDRADVAVLVVDASLGLTDQDQRVAGFAKERGCALVIVVNKWDIPKDLDDKEHIKQRLQDRMEFVSYACIVLAVAKTGKNTSNIWEAIDLSYNNFCKKLPTSKLNNWLSEIKESGVNVSAGKRSLKLKYVTQVGVKPPRFTFFVNHSTLVSDNFKRFLENKFRQTFDMQGTPVIFNFKSRQ